MRQRAEAAALSAKLKEALQIRAKAEHRKRGAGRALASWIVNGTPTTDLTSVDIRRFAPFNGNNRWLHDRVAEILGLHYEIPWPNREMATARPFRRSSRRAIRTRMRATAWARRPT